MTDHAESIKNLITTLTEYTGGYFPAACGINEVNAANRFFVIRQRGGGTSETHWTSEQYKITLQASSEANLHTLKDAVLGCSSDVNDGWIPTEALTSPPYPTTIQFTSQGKTTQSGPNTWMCELTLLASYEVS